VERVIIGKREVIELMLVTLLCHGHLLIEDVPGIGKTTLAKAVARSLGCTYRRIQCTPDLMPSDIIGINFYNQKMGDFEFRPGPVFAQIILADEVNRATPRTQSALLEAMEERQVTLDGVTMPLPQPFLVLATQNPIELEGTFPLPEAQLVRFLLRLNIGYPDADEESRILLRFEADNPLDDLQPVLSADELLALQRIATTVRCDDSLREYIVALVQASRIHPAVEIGGSPRAALGLFRASRALAAIRGRDYVLPDDIKYLAPFVLGHRLILSSQSRLRGSNASVIIDSLLHEVPVPVLDSEV
jgi:MoxR-like ATPase